MTLSKIKPDNRTHQIVFWLIISSLLFLRIPFMAGMRLLYGFKENDGDWINIIWQLSTYFLTAILIWWEHDNLSNYHIDTSALIIILLSLPIQTLVLASWGWGDFYDDILAFPRWGAILAWVISFSLIMALWRNHYKIQQVKLMTILWPITGIFLGIFWNLLSGNHSIPFSQLTNLQSWAAFLNPIGVRFLYHLGASSGMEEPLFRGFLWGGLRKIGWPDFWIWVFQAALFDLSHIYYWNFSSTAFISILLSGLFFGLIAWYSKSISTSLTAHSIVNAFW